MSLFQFDNDRVSVSTHEHLSMSVIACGAAPERHSSIPCAIMVDLGVNRS